MPPPAVYGRAAERLDRPIEAYWLVSANAWVATGAAAAGMRVAWVNRTRDPPERVEGEPNLTVGSLTELAQGLE